MSSINEFIKRDYILRSSLIQIHCIWYPHPHVLWVDLPKNLEFLQKSKIWVGLTKNGSFTPKILM